MDKGILWHSHPAVLQVRFSDSKAQVSLHTNSTTVPTEEELTALAERMLGLHQDVAAFEDKYAEHPLLSNLIKLNPGLRIPTVATPFEAFAWAITGQQISVTAAISIRSKLIQAAGIRHSSDMYCFPDAAHVSALGYQTLRECGFSDSKANCLLNLSKHVSEQDYFSDRWLETLGTDKVRETLLSLKGIGPWTINYGLLRGFGWLDESLETDAAVRRNLARLLNQDKITPGKTAEWLAQFSPYRSLVAAHLWEMG
ncbi:AlkA N-terminal domain-containing protein [Aliamphritea spongicola]|nr:AlkA N-terminal domain-containing protein [Aliamphritea spongicola]